MGSVLIVEELKATSIWWRIEQFSMEENANPQRRHQRPFVRAQNRIKPGANCCCPVPPASSQRLRRGTAGIKVQLQS